MDRRKFISIMGGLTSSLLLCKESAELQVGKDELNLLERYMTHPISVSDGDLARIPDPALMRRDKPREDYLALMKSAFVDIVRKTSGESTANIIEQAPFIYDSDGAAALRQADEFKRDSDYYALNPNVSIVFGAFCGSYSKFLECFERLSSKERTALFLSNMRAMVPFSLSSVGSREIYPVYFFPFWFEEFFLLERGAKNKDERNILAFSDFAHETAHLLFNYSGPYKREKRVTGSNASEVLDIANPMLSGALWLVNEGYGTQYQVDVLKPYVSLLESNSKFRKKITRELTLTMRRHPALYELNPKLRQG